MMVLTVLISLSLVYLVSPVPTPGRENVCSSQVVAQGTRTVYYPVSYQVTGSRSCGFWGRRCRTYSRRYTTGSRPETFHIYSTNYYCCTGWAEDGTGGCSIPICSSSCGVGGTCVSPNICECYTGFDGALCDDINECLDSNGGCSDICVNTVGNFYCECSEGYVETDDGECIATCDPVCCSHGECTSPNHCECEGDYTGNDCCDLNECWSDDNGGCAHICDNFNGGFRCECFPGYALSALTDCLPICEPLCENYGKCTGPNICDCADAYTGNRCQWDFNECLVDNGGCDHLCENFHGGFTCSCLDGFTGTSNCTDIDECSYANCHSCINLSGSFRCQCNTGYQVTEDLYNCEDINECTNGIAECSQLCSNYIGSFSCDCNNGWTLETDQKSCTANPCVEIGVPFGGTRNCTGFTTGEWCFFKCEWNYRLLGSDSRQCLPNKFWDGQLTECEEILCPELPIPSNGFLNFPCENQVGSVCTFGCDPGYFMEEDVVVECLLTGLWNNTGPVCTRILACNPSPCVNGVCHLSQNEPGGYTCDCTGTGYAGKNCAEGYVTTPSWPEIWVGSEYNNLVFIAKPKQSLDLNIILDSDKVDIAPIQLSFTPEMNIQNVSIRGISQGFVTISYVLRGTEAADFSAREDDEMFVFENNYPSDHHERFTVGYQLPSGCYVLSDQSTCASLISTEEWMEEKEISTNKFNYPLSYFATTGIVSLATNKFEFPLRFNGHSAQQNMPETTTRSNCDSNGLTVDHVQDFVHLNSLYRNYTRQLENVLPDWITFISVNINPLNAKTSFSTFSLSGSEVKSIEWCSYAPVISGGLYSVYLLYNSSMIVGGRRISLPVPRFKGKYCLIVGVCSVTYGTVMMVFPEGSRNILGHVDDIKQDGSIEINANCLAFSTTDKLNPNGKYDEQEEKISLSINMQYSYNINKSSVSAQIEGSGNLYVKLENTKQLFSHLFLHRWVLQQFGDSKIILFWKVLGKDIKLAFKSTQMHSPILNVSIGDYPPGEISSQHGIIMNSSASFGVFDDTPFSWLLKPRSNEDPVDVFLNYDLTPNITIPYDLISITQIINQLQNLAEELDTLSVELSAAEFIELYSDINFVNNFLRASVKKYYIPLSRKNLKLIGNSLSQIRIQIKETLKSLWFTYDTLDSSSNQHNTLRNYVYNVTKRLEDLSNQILVEVQDVFAFESTSGSGFRMTSELCLSSYLCFPPLEVEILNSNLACSKNTELLQTNLDRLKTCITGKYSINETLNSFISIPAGSKFSLTLESNQDRWFGRVPILTSFLHIEQETMLELSMKQIQFQFSGKLWGLYDMKGNATSELSSFESMILHVNGDVSVDDPLTLGRIIKDRIIKLSEETVADSERRLNQGYRSFEIAKSKLNVVLEEEAVKKKHLDNVKTKYASAKNDVNSANITVEMARVRLEQLRNAIQVLQNNLNNVCKISECEGVCVPGSKVVVTTEDVYGDVPYKCCGTRTETVVVNERFRCCSECLVLRAVKKRSWFCRFFRIGYRFFRRVFGRRVSAVINVIRVVRLPRCYRWSWYRSRWCYFCNKKVKLTVEFHWCSTCVQKKLIGQVQKLVTEEVACSFKIPNTRCVRNNEQCRKTRKRLFDILGRIIPGLVVPIEELDNAILQASIADAALNDVLVQRNDAMDQHKEVLQRMLVLQANFNNTKNALEKIKEHVEAGLAIKEHQINGSIEKSLEFKELKFHIDLVGEDTTVIPMVCNMTLSSVPIQIKVFIDVNNLNHTIENAAVFITEGLFGDITRSGRRRRSVHNGRHSVVNRDRRDTATIIEQTPIEEVEYVINNTSVNISSVSRDQKIVQNEERCEEYNDILNFVEHAFQKFIEVATLSKEANLQTVENEENFQNEYLYNLSVASSSDTVNKSAALLYFNLTTDDLQENNTSSENDLEKNSLIKVIDSAKVKANNTKSLLQVDNVVSEWELVMDIYIYNSSDLDCDGFYDCLTTELIALKYLSEGRQSYHNVDILDETISRFLDLNASSLQDAVDTVKDVLSQGNLLRLHNDVCLTGPNITEHPESEIMSVEGSNVTLRCQATGKPTPEYTWKFNGKKISSSNSNVLLLKEVNSSDSGSYTCHATNEVTSVQSLQSDVIVEFPPFITDHPQNADIDYGNPEGTYFTCLASAQPLSDYRWYFQSNLSSVIELLPGHNESVIDIFSPEFDQDGWYTCEAWNEHGQHFSNPARLLVLNVSMPEFSSDISVMFYRIDITNSTYANNSLNNTLSNIINEDELELELINLKQINPGNKAFLTEISFEIKSTNITSINVLENSRNESEYRVQNKIKMIRTKVIELTDVFSPGKLFQHRGEVLEVTKFNAGDKGPICPNHQYAHQDGYICVNCPPGSYRGNDELPAICQPCPVGYYQPKQGQTECLKCYGDSGPDTGSRICMPEKPELNLNDYSFFAGEEKTLSAIVSCFPNCTYQWKTDLPENEDAAKDKSTFTLTAPTDLKDGDVYTVNLTLTNVIGSTTASANITISNPCSSQPCENAGICVVVDEENYYCNCTSHFIGSNCSLWIYKHGCEESEGVVNCDGNGTCNCRCDSCRQFNMTTTHCENASHCRNGGECIVDDFNDPPSFTCNCTEGYYGNLCEHKILNDPCSNKPCKNDGICEIVDEENYYCNCTRYFNGKNCSIWIFKNGCEESGGVVNCDINGTCNCKCDSCHQFNMSNSRCESANRCRNGGECIVDDIDDSVDFICNCTKGYNGTLCEHEISTDYHTLPNEKTTISTTAPSTLTGPTDSENSDLSTAYMTVAKPTINPRTGSAISTLSSKAKPNLDENTVPSEETTIPTTESTLTTPMGTENSDLYTLTTTNKPELNLDDYTFFPGEEKTIPTTVSCNPNCTYQWYTDLPKNEDVAKDESTLTLTAPPELEDGAVHTVTLTVTNSAGGSTTTSAKITIAKISKPTTKETSVDTLLDNLILVYVAAGVGIGLFCLFLVVAFISFCIGKGKSQKDRKRSGKVRKTKVQEIHIGLENQIE